MPRRGPRRHSAAVTPLEAAIHYSGRLNVLFPPDEYGFQYFQLDRPNDRLEFKHKPLLFNGFAGFQITTYLHYLNGFRGYFLGIDGYVSKLSFGQNISAGYFIHVSSSYSGYMVFGGYGQWTDPGRGFVGFRFNSGAGFQYGWARIKMDGAINNNAFGVADYAYADPGEPIRAGQTSSDNDAVKENSLGGLALGALGLLAWRKSRWLTAR
jgi:hypothetical protein